MGFSRGGGIRNKHRNGCVLCTCLSASSPSFGYITHPISGRDLGLCFKHVVSLCRTPKHAETDGLPFKTLDSWYQVKMGARKRWLPSRAESFELKSTGWEYRLDDSRHYKWNFVGGEGLHENWKLVTGTHGKLPNIAKSPKDIVVDTEQEDPDAKFPTELELVCSRIAYPMGTFDPEKPCTCLKCETPEVKTTPHKKATGV